MFNLDKELQLWKSSVLKIGKLTNDDIEELESHILDKIDELQKNGSTVEKAFNLAISDLGSKELLSDEYNKLNYKTSTKQKLAIGIMGFIFFQFIFSAIEFFTFIVSAPYADKLMSLQTINIPIINSFMKLLIGSSYINNLSIFSLLFSTLISVIIFSSVFSMKNSIIVKYLSLIEKYNTQKLPSFILTALIPLALIITSIFSPILYKGTFDANGYGYITSALAITSTLVYISLIILFINKLKRLNTNNYYMLQTLGGYLIINTLLFTMPSLLTLSVATLASTNFIIALALYYCIVVLGFYNFLYSNNSVFNKAKNYLTHKNKLYIIGIIILALQLIGWLMPPIFAAVLSINKYGEISLINDYAYLIIKLFLPIICYLLSSSLSIKSSMKSLLYKK